MFRIGLFRIALVIGLILAAAIAFLASEEASYATGHSLVVDGGLLLMSAMANQLASNGS